MKLTDLGKGAQNKLTQYQTECLHNMLLTKKGYTKNCLKVKSKKLPSDFFSEKKVKIISGLSSCRCSIYNSKQKIINKSKLPSYQSMSYRKQDHYTPKRSPLQTFANYNIPPPLIKIVSQNTNNRQRNLRINKSKKVKIQTINFGKVQVKEDNNFDIMNLTFSKNIRSQQSYRNNIKEGRQKQRDQQCIFQSQTILKGKVKMLQQMNKDWKRLLVVKKKLLTQQNKVQYATKTQRNSLQHRMVTLPPIQSIRSQL